MWQPRQPRPAAWPGAAGAVGAVAADHHVHRAEGPQQGVRHLRGDRRAGAAIGLLLGGALTEYLSWRWTLYVNLIFAGVAFTGGLLLLKRQPSPVKPRLDVPGALLVSSAVFCLVYGFSNTATHHWATPSTDSTPPRPDLTRCLQSRGCPGRGGGWRRNTHRPDLPQRG